MLPNIACCNQQKTSIDNSNPSVHAAVKLSFAVTCVFILANTLSLSFLIRLCSRRFLTKIRYPFIVTYTTLNHIYNFKIDNNSGLHRKTNNVPLVLCSNSYITVSHTKPHGFLKARNLELLH
jgi:hypothetical protein